MFEAGLCRTTVSILEAIVFGAGNACVDIGTTSMLSAVAVFIGAVVLIRFIAMRLLRVIFPGLFGKKRTANVPPVQPDNGLQRKPYESPIKSTGAWGGTRR